MVSEFQKISPSHISSSSGKPEKVFKSSLQVERRASKMQGINHIDHNDCCLPLSGHLAVPCSWVHHCRVCDAGRFGSQAFGQTRHASGSQKCWLAPCFAGCRASAPSCGQPAAGREAAWPSHIGLCPSCSSPCAASCKCHHHLIVLD